MRLFKDPFIIMHLTLQDKLGLKISDQNMKNVTRGVEVSNKCHVLFEWPLTSFMNKPHTWIKVCKSISCQFSFAIDPSYNCSTSFGSKFSKRAVTKSIHWFLGFSCIFLSTFFYFFTFIIAQSWRGSFSISKCKLCVSCHAVLFDSTLNLLVDW